MSDVMNEGMRRGTMSAMSAVCAVAAFALVVGCSGESRRDAPAVTRAEGGSSGVADSSVFTANHWDRVAVTDARLESKDGKQVLNVKVKTAGPGWKLEVRPLPGTDPSVREFEVVGSIPEGKKAGALEERTVTSPVDLGEKPDLPVLVHGAGAAIFAQ